VSVLTSKNINLSLDPVKLCIEDILINLVLDLFGSTMIVNKNVLLKGGTLEDIDCDVLSFPGAIVLKKSLIFIVVQPHSFITLSIF